MSNLPTYGMTEGPFSTDLINKTFTIIRASDVKVGDVVVDFQCINFSHQTPSKITQAKRNRNFIHIKWGDKKGDMGQQYAETCLFGRLCDPS